MATSAEPGSGAYPLSIRADAELAADRGSPAAALALLTAAAEDIEPRAPLDAAVLLAEASFHALLSHGPARALELARDAAEVIGGADSDSAIIIRARLGDALQWNGLNREAMGEWLAASETQGSTDPRVRCTQAAALLRAGRLVDARERAYAAAARARQAGDRFSLRDALTFQTISEIHLGLLREARASAALLEDAPGLGPTTGERLEAIGVRAWVEALLGDEEACRERFGAAERLADELGVTTPSGGMAAGLLALSRGRFEEAATYLESKLNGGSAISAAVALRPFLDALVEACVHSGRIDRADALVREAFPAALEASQPRFAATAYRMRALVHQDPTDFGAALGEHRSWGNRFEEARTRLAYGEMLRRSRHRSEAREQLSMARSAFSTVGATGWERRARDELDAAGARLPRAASRVPLTPQEDRISQLVAEGLTNKEIALRLVISTKTVEGHLRNIFEKLGVRSRTQVARAVSE